MLPYNTVAIAQVSSVEEGDLIAYEFLGSIKSGKVLAKCYVKNDLPYEYLEYMKDNGLEIPKSDNDLLGGVSAHLIFWMVDGKLDHFYSSDGRMVAIFPYVKR